MFTQADGTKHLKPDVEAVCAVPGGVLLLGSGSTARRTRLALVPEDGGPVRVREAAGAYDAVARALGLDRALLDLEGAWRCDWARRGPWRQPTRGRRSAPRAGAAGRPRRTRRVRRGCAPGRVAGRARSHGRRPPAR